MMLENPNDNKQRGLLMKSFYSLFVLTIALILTSLSAHAIQQKTPLSADTKRHLTVTSVEVVDLSSQYENLSDFEYEMIAKQLNSTAIGSTLDQADLIVDKVINIGQKIWNVVEKGKPVANYANLKATALPANTTRWDQLESWQAPRSKVVSVVYKNVYGIEVVRFTYRIILLYGGSVNGVGKYIGYASVEPIEMTTAYMYTFNAKASIETVFNLGTSQNPLAGMILNINWTVETVLKKTTTTHTHNLDGLGNITTPTEKMINFSNLK